MPADLTPRYQGLDLRARRGGGAPAEEEEEAASTEGGRYGNEGGLEGARRCQMRLPSRVV